MNFAFSRTRALLVFALLVSATAARAEQIQSRKLQIPQGQIVDANAYPWSAIGKLNTGTGGSCTAILISPSYALTAAHCLYMKNLGHFIPAQSFHLIVGYQEEEYQDHFRISAYYVPPSYKPLKPYETLSSDWALLAIRNAERSTKGRTSLRISQVTSVAVNSTLATAGYSHHAPYVMTADNDCSLVGRSSDHHFIYDSCKAPAGFSGAPLLVKLSDNQSLAVAGIHVANQAWDTQVIAIAIPMDVIWSEIKNCVHEIAPELTGHGLPLSECEAYNRGC